MKSLDKAYETLILEQLSPGVVVVTLNRPKRSNAMTSIMFGELEAMALALNEEDDCRVVILTGAGNAFCAGYDLADADELPGLSALGMLDQQERAARALLSVRSMRVPVIAAVNGAAAGGGLALALAADIRLAAPEAKFNAAFVRIGLSAGDLGTSWLLTRLIGPAATSEICFTGRLVDAREAVRLGMVNQVSEPGAVLDQARRLAAAPYSENIVTVCEFMRSGRLMRRTPTSPSRTSKVRVSSTGKSISASAFPLLPVMVMAVTLR